MYSSVYIFCFWFAGTMVFRYHECLDLIVVNAWGYWCAFFRLEVRAYFAMLAKRELLWMPGSKGVHFGCPCIFGIAGAGE